ncbi:DUF4126 domain-containing protein [Desulforegula conservatrix]|uniref:DUF4126 domain-containing protein n=1 Tax=Desulforegula conservatrix TaxID=153026 RepID=UPI00040EED65|nr:DUF4126 domain-containing protein [Desulforegula conservatrix]
MGLVNTIALVMVVGWASGINLYAMILTLGILGSTGSLILPESLRLLTSPEIIALACFMYVVEFIVDKIPAFDSVWDAVHTFIRIPAGAVLAAAVMGRVDPALIVMAMLVGAMLSAGSHGLKMSTRLFINTSPEPFSNWAASTFEDILVVAGIMTALYHPIIFLLLLALFIALVIWLIPKLFSALKSVFLRVRKFLSKA